MKKAKKVVYNGGTESLYQCSEPTKLIVGKEYEVVSTEDSGWQTNYKLKGIEGEFNSIWFNEIDEPDDEKIYMAIGYKTPVEGERFFCYKLTSVEGRSKLVEWLTSTVKDVDYLGNNIYKVTTKNSTYIVNIG